MSRMQGLVISPGVGETSATKSDDVRDAQGEHGTGEPVQRSEVNFVRKSKRDGRTMEHEKDPADVTDSRHHDNARQVGEARPQARREASTNSFVHVAHVGPQPLRPEDLLASLVYEIKSASDTALR